MKVMGYFDRISYYGVDSIIALKYKGLINKKNKPTENKTNCLFSESLSLSFFLTSFFSPLGLGFR